MAVRLAGLHLEAAGVDVGLMRHQLAAEAVHDLASQQELAEARLVGLQQLADLPESLGAGVRDDVAVDELDLRGGQREGSSLALGLFGLVGQRPQG